MEVSTKYCRYCGRLLKNKDSISRGFGLTCYQKYLQSLRSGGLFARFRRKQREKCMGDEALSSEILHDKET